jgi:protein-tyrosine phosphatase
MTAAPYQVMFVCTGNTCRSPMAEIVLRSQLAAAGLSGRVVVSSSGLKVAAEGAGADPRTVAVLTAAGLPAGHAARQLTPRILAESDLVITMTGEHAAILAGLRPGQAPQIRTLRSFAPAARAGQSDVPDPFRDGPAAYQAVLTAITAAMPGLLAEIAAASRPDPAAH